MWWEWFTYPTIWGRPRGFRLAPTPSWSKEGETMAGLTVDTSEIRGNPLDVLEELVDANEWRFDRNSAEEMVVELSGRWCNYSLYFVWQEDLSAISFSCIVDLRVAEHRRSGFLELLCPANGKI